MKTINLQNNEVTGVYNALDNITVEGPKPRRGKGKLQKALKRKIEEFVEDLKDIQKDYFEQNEDESFKTQTDKRGKQNFVWKDEFKDDYAKQKQANEQVKELNSEAIGIDLVEHESKIKAFFDALEGDDFTAKSELKDEDFDTLMDVLEDAFASKENQQKGEDE